MNDGRGKLVVISGPSGAGKTSVCKALKAHPDVEFSVSATTRALRAGEQDGIDYHFLSRDDFQRRIGENQFLEWASYNGNLYGTTTGGGGVSEGTVFKLDTAGHESVLLSFNNVNGLLPASGVILDVAGNLYGTADGGPGGAGVLFRLDKNGNATNFHVFQGGFDSEAGVPAGGVITDEAGNFYGATLAGGLGPFPGFGTVYRVDPTGNFTVLYKFHGNPDGAGPQGPLVRDADGNLYGAAVETFLRDGW